MATTRPVPVDNTSGHLSVKRKVSVRAQETSFHNLSLSLFRLSQRIKFCCAFAMYRHIVFRDVRWDLKLVRRHNFVKIFHSRQIVNLLFNGWSHEGREPPRHHL